MNTVDQQTSKGIIFFIWISLFMYSSLYADGIPTGGEVKAGQAQIQQNTAQTLIQQSTDKAIINWQDFSVGSNHTVEFQQPASSSWTLNRVVGPNTSHIMGQVLANGNIAILNGNGVLFSAGAQVNVAGLLATTANILDEDFMAGEFNLQHSSNYLGLIINQGNINADNGFVILLAPGVENQGIIQANLGQVHLASGMQYTINFQGDNLINFSIDEPLATQVVDVDGNPINYAVSNSGVVQADGGQVYLTTKTAEQVLDNVINMSGVVQANSMSVENGVIILDGGDQGIVEVSGHLEASGKQAGQTGGQVKVLGHMVGLVDAASIDVTGDVGGGEVLLGGEYLGQGDTPTAYVNYFAENAQVDASAINHGDGGRVIVWADNTTRFFGNIAVRGGMQSGDGGFVETSGKMHLDVLGMVDASSEHGESGIYLLDPMNLTISDAVTQYVSESTLDTIKYFISYGNESYLQVSALITALASNNVEINATNDIIFENNTSISSASTNDLTITSISSGDIEWNSSTMGIDIDGNLTLITTDGDIKIGGDLSTSTSASETITLTAGGGSITNPGNKTITTKTLTMTAADGIGTLADPIDTTVDKIALSNTTSGDVYINETNALGLYAINNSTRDIFLTAGGAITDADSGSTTNITAADLTVVSVGGFGIHDPLDSNHALAIDIIVDTLTLTNTGGGDVAIFEFNNIDLYTVDNPNGTIAIRVSAAIHDKNGVATNLTADVVILKTDWGIGSSNNPINTTTNELSVNNLHGSSVYILESDTLILNASSVNYNSNSGGDLDVQTTAGHLTVAGALSALSAGKITLKTLNTSANLNINAAITVVDGKMSLHAGNDVNMAAAGDLISTNGEIEVHAADKITMSSDTSITVSGTGEIDMQAGDDITLGLLSATSGNITVDSTSGSIKEASANTSVNIISTGGLVTLNAATGIGSSGSNNAIDTTVVTLALDNSTSGDIAIVETNAVTLTTLTPVTTASVYIQAGNELTMPAAAFSLTGDGALTFASGAGSDLTLLGNLQTADGDIILKGENIDYNSKTVTSTGSGNITLNYLDTSGETLVTALISPVSIGTGTLIFDSAGDVVLGALSRAGDNIKIVSAGNITDNNAGTLNITAADLTLEAATGIGSSGSNNAIDTTVVTLALDNSASGDVYINETNALGLYAINNSTRDIFLTAGGAITDADSGSTTNITAADLTVVSVGGFGIHDPLDSNHALAIDIIVDTLTLTNTGGGDVAIFEFNNIDLYTVDNPNGTIAIRVSAAIHDKNGVATNLTADVVILKTDWGIGSSNNPINTTTNELSVNNLHGSSVYILESDTLILNASSVNYDDSNEDSNSGGDLDVQTTAGHLTVAGALSALSAGKITLKTLNTSANLNINAAITVVDGKMSLHAGNDVNMAAAGDLISTDGEIEVHAGVVNSGASAHLFMDASTSITVSGTGIIDMQADGDITLGTLSTTTGSITVDSTGGLIQESSADESNAVIVDINSTSGVVTLKAETGIGSSATNKAIDTTVATLILENTYSGDVYIIEADDLILDSSKMGQYAPSNTAVNLNVHLTNGDLTVNGIINELIDVYFSYHTGSIYLAANNINLNKVITSKDGDIILTAVTGDIVFSDIINLYLDTEYGDGNITLLAGQNIVLGKLYTSDGTINVTATNGNIDIIANIHSKNGDIILTAVTGDIVFSETNTPYISTYYGDGNITLLAGQNIVLGELWTHNGTINVTATNGNIDIIGNIHGYNDSSGNGEVLLTAVTGDIVFSETNTPYISTYYGSGNITLLAGQNIVLGLIKTHYGTIDVTATNGYIHAVPDGAYFPDQDFSYNILSNNVVNLTASTGIGELNNNYSCTCELVDPQDNSIDMGVYDGVNVSVVNAINTGVSGDIVIYNPWKFTFHAEQQSSDTNNIRYIQAVVSGPGENLIISDIDASTPGIYHAAANGNVILYSANGGIFKEDTSGNYTSNVNISVPNTATLIANKGIGAVGNNREIITQVGELELKSIENQNDPIGSVAIIEQDDVILRYADIDSEGLNLNVLNGALTIYDVDVEGSISLVTNNDMIVNDTITSNTGQMNLIAGRNLTFSANGDLSSSSGDVKVQAGGYIDMHAATVINSGAGHLDVFANNNIVLGNLISDHTKVAINIVSKTGSITGSGASKNITVTNADARVYLRAAGDIGTLDNPLFSSEGYYVAYAGNERVIIGGTNLGRVEHVHVIVKLEETYISNDMRSSFGLQQSSAGISIVTPERSPVSDPVVISEPVVTFDPKPASATETTPVSEDDEEKEKDAKENNTTK